MTFEQMLLGTPVADWVTDLAIIFDWYDGPREGVCRLAVPDVEFRFRLLDERPNPDGLDDRLLRLDELPAGSVRKAQSALSELGEPTSAFWVPVWRFATPESKRRADEALREIESEARPTPVVVLTRDMTEFFRCWSLPENGESVKDWFAKLEVPA